MGIIIAIIFGSNLTGIAQNDTVEYCSKHIDCTERHHYCVWGKCLGKIPHYPAIGAVKIYNSVGSLVVRDSEGYYQLPSEGLVRLEIPADNKGEPFNMYVYSPHVAFGSKGNSENLRLYHPSGRADIGRGTGTYGVTVNKGRFRDNYQYPFYFSLLAFPGEKFSIYVYLQEYDRGRGKKSQIIEIPIKATEQTNLGLPFKFGPMFRQKNI